MAKLATLLAYRNSQVITHYSYKNPHLTCSEVEQNFEDLLAWLWLKTYRQSTGRSTYLFGPLLALDEMWHIFILHTEDYCNFCEMYFGTYLHHTVEPIGYEHQLTEEELDDFLQDCFKFLGKEWVLRHFSSLLMEA